MLKKASFLLAVLFATVLVGCEHQDKDKDKDMNDMNAATEQAATQTTEEVSVQTEEPPAAEAAPQAEEAPTAESSDQEAPAAE